MSTEVAFSVSYTAKDVILYALSIGFGSSAAHYKQDLPFLWEDHPDEFATVPTFCLSLIFWAQTGRDSTCSAIPAFPPPLMRATGVLPRRFLSQDDVNIDQYPLLHTFTSVSWYRDMPAPRGGDIITATLKERFLSVVPKAVGTFVNRETKVYARLGDDDHLLCTMQSTTLVLGIQSKFVIPYADPKVQQQMMQSEHNKEKKELLFERDCCIAPNQALLYRLASGDSNRIHVDPTANPLPEGGGDDNSGNDCLLHGLCTLGIATRMILQFLRGRDNTKTLSVRQLSGKFVKPVFVNDSICVQAWTLSLSSSDENTTRLEFVINNKRTGDTVLEGGQMMVETRVLPKEAPRSRL